MFLVFKCSIFLDRLDVLDFKNLNIDFALLNHENKSIFLAFLYGVVLEFVNFIEVLLMGSSQKFNLIVFKCKLTVIKLSKVGFGLNFLFKVDNSLLFLFEEFLGFHEFLFGLKLLFKSKELMLGL
jgi:hypothetical protein